jgi:hypothetical protein
MTQPVVAARTANDATAMIDEVRLNGGDASQTSTGTLVTATRHRKALTVTETKALPLGDELIALPRGLDEGRIPRPGRTP